MTSTGRGSAVKGALASASLGASAAGLASLTLDHGVWQPGVLGVAAVVGAAAVGLARRGVLTQVLSRGVAWMVLTPSLLSLGDALWHGRLPDAHTAFFATTSAAALLLARGALHSDAARAEFSPVGYRRVFLAGAVASAMTGTVMALFAAEGFAWGALRPGLALTALAAALLASAVGVVRMRAWGVLLGLVTSVVLLGVAALAGSSFVAMGLALAAIPGMLLASPLVAARVRPPPSPSSLPARPLRWPAELEDDGAMPPVLARVGVSEGAEPSELAAPAMRIGVAGERR